MKTFRFVLAIFFLIILFGFLPLIALTTNLLVNNGFNDPYENIPDRVWSYQGTPINEQIANGWRPFYLAGGTNAANENAKRLHWMSSKQFADTFHGLDYHIEGNRAQNMWSSYEFDAGVYQEIAGVSPGQAYGFDIAMVTYWRGPGYADSDGKMVKQVGLDPTGGVDPTSSNIIWSDPDANDKAWVYMDVAATTQASTITVFAKVQAPDNNSYNHTDLDMVYFDAAHVAPVPTTTLNISSTGTTVDLSWLGSSPAPSWSFKGYELQVYDHADGIWTTLQPKNNVNTNYLFSGQPGHIYTFRVRAWQRIDESYQSDIDLPGPWQEQTVTLGALISGRVIDNQGYGLSGVTVTESESITSVTTGNAGNYMLALANPGVYTLTAGSIGDWTPPPPISISVQLNSLTYLTFTLRPPDNVVDNGDFESESDLNGWQVSGTPELTAAERHSGISSIRLAGTATLSQTRILSGSYQPVLSFWYKLDSDEANDTFAATLLDADGLATNTFTTSIGGDWQHVALPLDLAEVYTGSVGMYFSLQSEALSATVYLDEVSLGASWGGPNKIYLPVIFK